MGWKGESRRHSLSRKGIKTNIDPHKRLSVGNYVARGSPTEDLIINENAKSHFGVTDSPYEAGYLLTDGTMLDFSDGHNQKWLDHGEIKAVLDANQTQRDFVNMGNIRMSVTPSHSTMLLQMKKIPTNSQRRKIARLMKGITGEILIDMYVQEADQVKIKSKRYTPFDNPTKVFNDIDWRLGAN